MLSPTTISKRMVLMGTLFKWAVRNGNLKMNPAEALSVKDKRSEDEKRQPCPTELLQKLIDELKIKFPKDGNRPERFLVPLIALYSGLRLNEACQLYKKDIVNIDHIHCFIVNDFIDKRKKTKNSYRSVPIHPKFIDLDLP